jgi:hypothetical protein
LEKSIEVMERREEEERKKESRRTRWEKWGRLKRTNSDS